ncbi:MAG: hypothetical protein AAGA03_13285, partial [Planctomycetota bacterium]
QAHTDRVEDPNVKKYQRPSASLCGLTYFYRFILADDPAYLGYGTNFYCRGPFERNFVNPFSGEKRDAFDEAKKLAAEGEHQQAAEKYATLASEFTSLAPLSILAAKSFAQADQDEAAIKQLARAIMGGWQSLKYLENDEHLSELIQDPRLAPGLARLSDAPATRQLPVGFQSAAGWTASGFPVAINAGGLGYMLSCMLGTTQPHASSVDQVIDVLERAAGADRTFPKGAFGYSKTKDVRTTTRFPGFADALVWLKTRDHETNVFQSAIPTDRQAYVGMMLGTASMPLDNRSWRFLPGAIAESLTSHGGNYATASQTKLNVLLHAGAAMSSGTVDEPFSIQPKFPHPMMYPYYAEGVTAIEAFYLSVASPYQLLIVGDPLCQPFAPLPQEFVRTSLDPGEANTVVIQKQRISMANQSSATARMQLYLDGRLVKTSPPANNVRMKLPESLSGSVEVRTVLVGNSGIQPRFSYASRLNLNGPLVGPVLQASGSGGDEVGDANQFQLTAQCTDAKSIKITHLGRLIGTIDGSRGTLTVDRTQLGDGPLRLRGHGVFDDARVSGTPLVID